MSYTTKATRVFLKLKSGTILDVRDVKLTRNGEFLLGYVSNGRYPIELIDGVMFMSGLNGACEGVQIIFEGDPPGHPVTTSCNKAVAWVRNHQLVPA